MPDPSPQGTPVPTQDSILNSATLILGPTKVGKSSLLATLAEYGWETHRAVSFFYSVDGGGFPSQMQALIRTGIVRYWQVRSRSAQNLVPETLHRMSLGWWPARINPLTGECAPSERLVAPVTEMHTLCCPDGHVIRTSAALSGVQTAGPCPTCKKMVDRTTWQIRRTTQRTKGFPEKRICLFDGMSASVSWLMGDLAMRELGGEKSALGGLVLSGDMVFGTNNRAQVGFAQKAAEGWAVNSISIPDLVVPPVWTGLIQEGTDEGGLAVKGLQLAGQAKTAEAPQWFGNVIEATTLTRDAKKYRRLNLQTYVDERGARHLCGVRSFPGALPSFLEDEEHEDGSGAFVNFNLGLVHRLLDEARSKTEEMYKTKYPDAPGVGVGAVDYGEVGAAPSGVSPGGSTPARPAPAGLPRPAGGPQPAPTSPGAPRQQVTAPGRPATPTPVAATPAPPPAVTPAGSALHAAQQVAAPPKPPARGPSAPPPGRRPTPAPTGAPRPSTPPPATSVAPLLPDAGPTTNTDATTTAPKP